MSKKQDNQVVAVAEPVGATLAAAVATAPAPVSAPAPAPKKPRKNAERALTEDEIAEYHRVRAARKELGYRGALAEVRTTCKLLSEAHTSAGKFAKQVGTSKADVLNQCRAKRVADEFWAGDPQEPDQQAVYVALADGNVQRLLRNNPNLVATAAAVGITLKAKKTATKATSTAVPAKSKIEAAARAAIAEGLTCSEVEEIIEQVYAEADVDAEDDDADDSK